ncbi:unnamed protein product, partial [Callosobruchus maculatus]
HFSKRVEICSNIRHFLFYFNFIITIINNWYQAQELPNLFFIF